jgi:hypothetical protein
MKRYLLRRAAGRRSPPAGRRQTVLTVSSWVPPTHSLSVAQKEWCDLVEKNSSGKIKCNILPRAVAAPPGTFDASRTAWPTSRSPCTATRRTLRADADGEFGLPGRFGRAALRGLQQGAP